MARIIYSSEALRDLEKIGDYIAFELQNPTASLNTLNIIQDKISTLATFPRIGTLLSAICYGAEADDYRFLVCANYLAFYRVEGDNVIIDRIIYKRRDYIAVLFDGLPLNDDGEERI
ncbi:MAG: type II toxin-antitoxin system RelE/ParE family toxin [Lachnospiraceae bacterium]|nr:type II toxin-antitoxin system RelE/ParE family toxin [Lachnospiraceae bacterium]